MSSKVTINQSKGVRVVGLLAVIAGIVLVVAGALTYWQVSVQLRAENITVSQDASFLAGKRVQDPLTAYAQAEVINDHAKEMADGKTYAELDQDDPLRDTVMNASFLRASLFTSVVAFGLAAVVFGLGVFLILLGWALRRIAGGPAIVVENFDSGPAPRHGAGPRADEAAVTGAVPAVASDATRPSRVSSRTPEPSAQEAATSAAQDGSDGADTTVTGATVVPAEGTGVAGGEAAAATGATPTSGAQVSQALRRHSLAERRAAAERAAEDRSSAAGAWASARTGATPAVPDARAEDTGAPGAVAEASDAGASDAADDGTAAVPVPPSAWAARPAPGSAAPEPAASEPAGATSADESTGPGFEPEGAGEPEAAGAEPASSDEAPADAEAAPSGDAPEATAPSGDTTSEEDGATRD